MRVLWRPNQKRMKKKESRGMISDSAELSRASTGIPATAVLAGMVRVPSCGAAVAPALRMLMESAPVRVLLRCFRAGALATGCKIQMKLGTHNDDLRQNRVLGAYA